MVKRAIASLAALMIALTGTAYAFADSSAANDSSQSYTQTEELSEEKAEEFALENEDPEYGKYLASLEEDEVDFSKLEKEAGGGADVYQYGSQARKYVNNSLIHNSRFDKMDKVWGIDVSYFQNDIDWKQVKAEGIEFAIIRVGYRGYGSGGQLVLDYKFLENIKEAKAAGLDVGVYFFTQAITVAEAREEADFVYSYIKDYKLELPVYFDMESIDYDVGRLDSANLTRAEKTAIVKAFCDRIESKGYEAGVYSNPNWLYNMLDASALEKEYRIWLAHYTTQTSYTGLYDTWQFTGSGKVGGIGTAVDINVAYIDPEADKESQLTVDEVENFKVTLNGSKATFKWDKVTNATRYELFRYNPTRKTYSKIANVSSNSATVTLISGSYGYCVRAVRASGGNVVYSGYSDILYVAKDAVTNFNVSASDTTVSMSWSGVSGAAGYEIYFTRSADSDASYSRYKTLSGTSFSVRGLKRGGYYSYKVRPYFVSSSGSKTYGSFSAAQAVVIAPEKLGVPSHSSSTVSSISVQWTGVDYADGYQVAVMNPTTGKYEIKATTSASTKSATIKGLSAATAYRVKVRAYVKEGGITVYGSYSSYKTCGTAPAEPEDLYVKSIPSTITLTWDKVSGATSYIVYKHEGGKYTQIATVNSNSYAAANTGVYPQSYAVRAVTVINNRTLTGTYSDLAVLPDKQPPVPVLKNYSPTGTSVKLNWNACSGVTGYRVYKYDAAKRTYVGVKTLAGASNTSYTVTGLDPYTQYKFKVKAFTKTSTGIAWGSATSAYNTFTIGRR